MLGYKVGILDGCEVEIKVGIFDGTKVGFIDGMNVGGNCMVKLRTKKYKN